MNTSGRTAEAWYREAERAYLNQHQGCAWCGGSHRVFQTQQGSTIVYFCNACDFKVAYDRESDTYECIPGIKDETGKKKTMFVV